MALSELTREPPETAPPPPPRGLAAVWKARHFWWHLTKSELRARYRRSYLGILWSLLNPLLMMLICTLVFGTLWREDPLRFAPFVFSGLVTWEYIGQNTTGATGALLYAEPYIRQAPLPVVIYPLRTTLVAFIHFVITVSLLTAFSVATRGPSHSLLSLSVSLPILLALGWCASTVNSILAVFFRDWMYLSTVCLQFLFYASPVIWPPELLESRGMGWVYVWNPIHHLMQLLRRPLLGSEWPTPFEYGMVLGTLLLFALLARAVSRSTARRLVFRL